jgi:translocation and assembly module TamB
LLRWHKSHKPPEDSLRDEDTRELPTVRRQPPPKNPWKQLSSWPWRRYWPVAAGIGAVLFVWLLPWMIAHSPIMTALIDRSAADLAGTVTARSASLGWFSPVVLYGVEVRDKQDQPVMEIAKLTGDKALLALLFDSSHLGRFRLTEPKVRLVVRDDGSNLEDLIAPYLDPKRPAGDVDVAMEVSDGTLTVEEPRTQRSWQVDRLELTLAVPADRAKPIEIKFSGAVPDQLRGGSVEAGLQVHRSRSGSQTDPDAAAPDTLVLRTDGAPLGIFEAVLRRFVPGMQLAGRVSASLTCKWDHEPLHRRVLVEGKLAGEDLRLALPALGTDRPTLARLNAAGQVLWQDGWVQCDRLSIESDVGSFTMSGVLDWRGAVSDRTRATLLHQTCEVSGNLDLARLAAILPHTLRIRKDTQVTSGRLQLQYAGRLRREGRQEGMVWQGRLEVSNLTATSGGRKLVWQQPVLLNVAAHEGPQGPVIETLQCDSNFLRLRAAGTRDLLTATATFDLSRLADQSAGFVDLGGLKLTGEGTAQLSWERFQEEHFETAGELRIHNFQWALPGRPAWTETALSASVTATGRADFKNNNRLETAALRIEAGPDQASARLMQPVAGFEAATWPLEIHLRGQLAQWQPRLGAWFNLAGWKLDGTCELLSAVAWGKDAIALRQTRLTAANLVIQGPSWNIQDPKVELTLAGRWDRTARRLDLEQAELISSALAARTANFLCAMPPQGAMRLSGTVKCNAALDRLQPWWTPPGTRPAWLVAGQFAGSCEIQQVGSIITARFDTITSDFTASNPAGQKFQEKEIRLTGRGSYNDVSRSFQIDHAELTSGALGITGTGKVARSGGTTDVQLSGKVDYDFERITQLIRARYGDGIRIAGRGSSPFAYRGPLAGEGATALLGFAWNWADIYGFQTGPGELQATFARGVLEVKPLALAVNEGQVQLAPRLHIAPGPVEFTLQPGRVVQQVRIHPLMCAHGLEYVAPVLAGIATAEGVFSIELDGCRIPIDAPGRGDLSGRLIVHDVRVGPGHLIQELAQLLGRANQVQITRQSVVPFRMVDGRIYHRDLELVFPEVTIRTYGSVGVEDQTLSMMAEMPVPARWQANPALGAALKNQVIQIPIAGTLRQPRLDRRAFDQLARQFMQNATQNVLEDQLNKQLERLIKPPAQAPKR